ncbi:lytic polysaccharide monooxygenase [Paenibacillus sp. 481]|uniref:lytic polysaccharide monooxygenase n=1 Tax=Paenibacillus sp. 481 TaxID=2835869 RepID=UPI001E3B2726|nr:lytic polysaccharide monooxygenase [Paenibacillus sp. 481]UHA73692.1 lytic polysaccharide monooxygenase [Paenibacillus sp. 481]
MIQQTFWNKLSLKATPLLVTGGVLLGLAGTLAVAETASAHGYIEAPASRAYLCKQGNNNNCGQVRYEPQSVEGKKGFPAAGPADGQLAGVGLYPELDAQGTNRWQKVTMNTGQNTFNWHITARHSTSQWRYFITKTGWDQNKPLSRDSLEQFCSYQDGGKQPAEKVSHSCTVPSDRSGYHVILGVWDVADTPNAFHQVIDVNVINDGSGVKLPSVPTNVVSQSQTTSSISLSWSASSATNGIRLYEVFRNGSLVGTTSQTSFTDSGLVANTSYTYTVQAVDGLGNKSQASLGITAKTSTNGGGTTTPAWDANTVYTKGKRVLYNGVVYEAQWWVQGELPGKSGAWKTVN